MSISALRQSCWIRTNRQLPHEAACPHRMAVFGFPDVLRNSPTSRLSCTFSEGDMLPSCLKIVCNATYSLQFLHVEQRVCLLDQSQQVNMIVKSRVLLSFDVAGGRIVGQASVNAAIAPPPVFNAGCPPPDPFLTSEKRRSSNQARCVHCNTVLKRIQHRQLAPALETLRGSSTATRLGLRRQTDSISSRSSIVPIEIACSCSNFLPSS